VILRPTTAIIACILEANVKYCPGSLNFSFGYIYITIIIFVSVSIAMFGLICIYSNFKIDLATTEARPILKFLAVKFVIFFCFWQSIVVAGFEKIDVIHATSYWTADMLLLVFRTFWFVLKC